jgi:hypothetical protein
MNDQADEYEPITFKRIQKRLSILIEVMPTSRTVIYSDKLLSNIKQDLIEIRAAIDYLQQRKAL